MTSIPSKMQLAKAVVHKSAHHGLSKAISSRAPRPQTEEGSATRFNQTFTLTFGDQAENHVGMQKIGQMAEVGFAKEDLERAQAWFESKRCECTLSNLRDLLPPELAAEASDAYILVIKRGASGILEENGGADALFEEQRELPKDTKALMYGRVVNKHARHNLCFSETSQDPAYELGKGRIVGFSEVPLLSRLRDALPSVMGDIASGLAVEGNYYYDLKACGIGYHGDSERKKVIGLRLGDPMLLCFAWFQQSVPISPRLDITLGHGDMYIMSEKTTGRDWKLRTIPTLRHAAGAKKFVQLPVAK